MMGFDITIRTGKLNPAVATFLGALELCTNAQHRQVGLIATFDRFLDRKLDTAP